MLVVLELGTKERNWDVTRVYFIRKGRVIADRILTEDMLWSYDGPEFVLFWNDYGNCHRVIRTKRLRHETVEYVTFDRADAVQWWAQGRRMTDLEAPPEN